MWICGGLLLRYPLRRVSLQTISTRCNPLYDGRLGRLPIFKTNIDRYVASFGSLLRLQVLNA